MKIYEIEKSLGLAEKITASKSIAYTNKLEPIGDTPNIDHLFAGAKAGVNDKDLYRTKSILVTSNWNKNDDVFGKADTWASKNTASHKPTNLEHDEKMLVGHITDCWAVGSDGSVLPQDTPIEDVPDLFHLVNGAVIYTAWEDEKLIARTQELIQQIESGQKFVSMECLFSDFGYAAISPDGEQYVIARSEDTAFLSKHLRSYGGTGEYNGHKIGRLLKNITFSGKGYVDNPANPNSVIFNDATVFEFSKASTENPFYADGGVSIQCVENISASTVNNTRNINMSELLQSQNTDLKTTVAKQSDEIKELRDLIAKSGVDKLEADLSDAKSQNESLSTELTESLASVETLKTEKATVETQLSEANTAKTDLETKIAEAEAKALVASRVSTLVDGDVDKEVAETKVDLYKSLSDEQFEAVAEEIISAVKAKNDNFGDKDKDKKKDKEDKSKSDVDEDEQDEAEANADETVIADAETDSDVALATVGDTGDELTEAQASLGRIFAAKLGVSVEE